jgi:CRISPR/Cas system-associated exonuclease Cas4 (RecB family)
MLFTLYQIYVKVSGTVETFDEFLYWGEMLLNDFDDVDKYMVDARMLFSNVTDLREIETNFSFLNPKQIAAIRTFWASFSPKGDAKNQREFLAVWQILYALYEEFRATLAAGGKGYEGMIFREVADGVKEERCRELGYDRIVFVGLNALSAAEEKLLLKLQRMGIADFYWDYASERVMDKHNRASFFALRNLKLFPSSLDLSPGPSPQGEGRRVGGEVEVVGIPSGVGQAKYVHTLFSEWCKEGKMEGEEALRTAIILPDESLLVPVLHSIPEEIGQINVTMGYPLSGTPVASLVDAVLSLQKNVRYSGGSPLFYFRDVLPVLNHRYLFSTDPEKVSGLLKEITRCNKVYIRKEELGLTPLLEMIFTPVEETDALAGYLTGLLEKVNSLLSSVPGFPLDSEYVFHYFTTVNRLKDVMGASGVRMKPETYARLLKRAADTVTIPFRGEPLSGVQIMGVLETRALDFDRIIILSMNDGVFPQRRVSNSFIPYHLRRGFGLPAYEHQDSIWAYHFYRLIHRAAHVSLVYDTRTTGLQTGEVSRFVHQLRYHYGAPVVRKLAVYPVSLSKTSGLSVSKDERVMLRLQEFCRGGGERAISASAINTYLDCPLKFYFSVVENTNEEETVSEAVESSMFGSILHATLEKLYESFRNRTVDAEVLRKLRDKRLMTETIASAFAEVFFKTAEARPLTGQNFLIGEMIRKYAGKVLEQDARLAPFRYIDSEKRMSSFFPLTDGREIHLKGFIDRIDEAGGALRIIDYKSGAGVSVFPSVPSLFDKEEKERAKAVMQVFLYAWMYGQLPEAGDRRIQPGIYYMRALFSPSFDSSVRRRVDRMQTEPVDDFRQYAEEYENTFRSTMDEIFGAETPFIQTPTGKACSYCTFREICGR